MTPRRERQQFRQIVSQPVGSFRHEHLPGFDRAAWASSLAVLSKRACCRSGKELFRSAQILRQRPAEFGILDQGRIDLVLFGQQRSSGAAARGFPTTRITSSR